MLSRDQLEAAINSGNFSNITFNELCDAIINFSLYSQLMDRLIITLLTDQALILNKLNQGRIDNNLTSFVNLLFNLSINSNITASISTTIVQSPHKKDFIQLISKEFFNTLSYATPHNAQVEHHSLKTLRFLINNFEPIIFIEIVKEIYNGENWIALRLNNLINNQNIDIHVNRSFAQALIHHAYADNHLLLSQLCNNDLRVRQYQNLTPELEVFRSGTRSGVIAYLKNAEQAIILNELKLLGLAQRTHVNSIVMISGRFFTAPVQIDPMKEIIIAKYKNSNFLMTKKEILALKISPLLTLHPL